ncbi:hypothetical protein MYSTI_00969 [Myxococcus stipitatus DSM 14675]|uniref:DUF2804 domain-containing protein n=1 Tax=Myxococcus stipitatus (strain DSM 14675 / JCM 12634 / Mx s8) TaxID=1278073 RepID=L7U279_MYXSD|nr:DUF2804 domain-containing protein [Myxococcus stipitatus]AGC42318.1 hypothetical protein MYSTI_00969 [Myxococcus stipitatus DSM 14675]
MTPESDARLPLAPTSVATPEGAPRFGTYQGELPEVDLASLQGPWAVSSLYPLRRAWWHSVFVATPDVFALFSVMNLGYTASAYLVALDLRERTPLCDVTFPGQRIEAAAAEELRAMRARPGTDLGNSFKTGGGSLSLHRGAADEPYRVDVDINRIRARSPLHGVRWSGELNTTDSPPALTVVSQVDSDRCRVDVTMKHACVSALGSLEAGGKQFRLEGGLGGLDYTQNCMARHQAWRWAFATGRLADGTPLGFNLREDFMPLGPVAHENVLWLGDRVYLLPPIHFEFSDVKLLAPWRVRSEDGAVDLRFQPFYVHSEHHEQPLCHSKFEQPIGFFEGTVTLGGKTLQLSGVPGVTQKQSRNVL